MVGFMPVTILLAGLALLPLTQDPCVTPLGFMPSYANRIGFVPLDSESSAALGGALERWECCAENLPWLQIGSANADIVFTIQYEERAWTPGLGCGENHISMDTNTGTILVDRSLFTAGKRVPMVQTVGGCWKACSRMKSDTGSGWRIPAATGT